MMASWQAWLDSPDQELKEENESSLLYQEPELKYMLHFSLMLTKYAGRVKSNKRKNNLPEKYQRLNPHQ